MWVFFDQTGAIAPQPFMYEYLTKLVADGLYKPYVEDFLNQPGAPTVNDDSSTGASEGSKWQDTSGLTDEWYLCSDAGLGVADWIPITVTPDELGTAALRNIGAGPTDVSDNTAMEAKIAAMLGEVPFRVVAVSDNVLSTDKGKVLVCTSATPINLTVNSDTVPDNITFGVYQEGAGQVTFVGAGTSPYLIKHPLTHTKTFGQYAFVSCWTKTKDSSSERHLVIAGGTE